MAASHVFDPECYHPRDRWIRRPRITAFVEEITARRDVAFVELRPHLTANGALADLQDQIVDALRRSQTDFRTVQSLANELGTSVTAVRHTLRALGTRVRNPLHGGAAYADWYRLTDNGPTSRERLQHMLVMAGRGRH